MGTTTLGLTNNGQNDSKNLNEKHLTERLNYVDEKSFLDNVLSGMDESISMETNKATLETKHMQNETNNPVESTTSVFISNTLTPFDSSTDSSEVNKEKKLRESLIKNYSDSKDLGSYENEEFSNYEKILEERFIDDHAEAIRSKKAPPKPFIEFNEKIPSISVRSNQPSILLIIVISQCIRF